MNSTYLFPARFKKVGIILFSLGILGVIAVLIYGEEPELIPVHVYAPYAMQFDFGTHSGYKPWLRNDLTDELILLSCILGGILWAFSKEKIEDEIIGVLRKDVLIWSIYINYVILALATIFIYSNPFSYLIVFNALTILVMFIARFEWLKYKHKNSNDEE